MIHSASQASGAQFGMLVLPRATDALGQEKVRPDGDQDLSVEVPGEVVRTARLPQHGFVKRPQHRWLVQVERPVRGAPEQPQRQLHDATHWTGQVRQTGRDQRGPSGARLVHRATRAWRTRRAGLAGQGVERPQCTAQAGDRGLEHMAGFRV
jgi:hypothetical protein